MTTWNPRKYLFTTFVVCLLACPMFAAEPTRYEGIALPNQQVQLTAPLQGIFQTVHVAEGDRMEENALIAEMKSDQQKLICKAAKLRAESDAAIRHAQYALEEAQILLEQGEKILTTQAASEWEVRRQRVLRDQAQAALDQARDESDLVHAAYELEQQRLDEHQLRAPFPGVINQIIRDPGSTVEQGEPLIVITDLSRLKAEIYLPAAAYHQLKVGDIYELQAGEPVNKPLEATLSFVNPVIDTASQTVRCVFVIPNEDLTLPAGFHFDIDVP
ncbi:MAG: efflux RND transporter periplasmic adaptor subunit [Phycisphaeraceae bacterium]|nr:efflux RND transporter periplasmic adaptor subunit [Phycisphaeraceae bacterium]